MPDMQVKGKQLLGTDVTAVALVKNGAVRMPFRIVKSEDGKETPMSIDLGKLGAVFKSATPAAPAITSVIFSEAHTEETAQEVMKSLGLEEHEEFKKTDNGLIASLGEGPQDGDTVIKLNESTAMTVANISKAFNEFDFESTDLGEVMKTEMFYPSMFMGMDMFSATVSNILTKSDSAADAAQKISKAATDFSSYIQMLADKLPEKSFKTDQTLAELSKGDMAGDMKDPDDEKKKKKAKKADESAEDEAKDEKLEKDDEAKGTVAKSDDDAGDNDGDGGESKVSPEDKEADKNSLDVEALQKGLLESFKGLMTDALGGLKEELVEKMDKDMGDLRKDVDGLKEGVKKTDNVLSQTLFGGGSDPDKEKEPAKKSADIPLMDTGFMTSEQVANL